jgi:hypothetical protein
MCQEQSNAEVHTHSGTAVHDISGVVLIKQQTSVILPLSINPNREACLSSLSYQASDGIKHTLQFLDR